MTLPHAKIDLIVLHAKFSQQVPDNIESTLLHRPTAVGY